MSLKYKVIHSTNLADDYGLEVRPGDPNGVDMEYVTASVMEQSLERAAADGWTLQHVLGSPRDPLLYLIREELGTTVTLEELRNRA